MGHCPHKSCINRAQWSTGPHALTDGARLNEFIEQKICEVLALLQLNDLVKDLQIIQEVV